MTDTRRQRTIILLETRTAWHPGLRSQFATFGAKSGEAPTSRTTCTACKGDGTMPSRTGPQPCERCEGKGSYLVDRYTGYRSREEGPWRTGGLSPVEKGRLADAEIQRMSSQTAPPKSERDLIEEANASPEPWERAREAHHRHGSYRELTLALEWLAGSAPNAWQLVTWVYELGMAKVTPAPLIERALYGVDLTAARLPDPIRVPPWLLPTTGAARRVADKAAA